MALVKRITQNSFNAGEFSGLMDARIDVSRYRSACRRLVNYVPLVQGAARRRPGLQYLQLQKNILTRGRVCPFIFSTDDGQSYQLEHGVDALGIGYIRFFWEDGLITIPATTAAVTNGSFTTDISGWTDASGSGSTISRDTSLSCLSLNSNGATEAVARQQVNHTSGGVLHVLAFRIITGPVKVRVGTTAGAQDLVAERSLPEGCYLLSFTPAVGNTQIHLQFAGAASTTAKKLDDISLQTGPLTMRTPFTSSDAIRAHKYTQSLDVVYLVQKSIAPYKLVRLGHTSWRLERIIWGPDIEPPVGLTATVQGTAGTRTLNYVVTVTDPDTEEQSLPSAVATVTTANDTLSETNYTLEEWLPSERGKEYRVYRLKNGVWGFMDTAGQPGNLAKFTITAATKANPCVLTAAGHDLDNGEHVWIQDVGGMTQLNGKFYTVADSDKTAGTFQLKGVDSSSYGTFTSGGTAQRSCWYMDDGSKKPDLTDTPPIQKDPFADSKNWPEAVSFYEQRMALATGPTLRFSQTANYENMNVSNPVIDSDALTYRIADGQDNTVVWMVPGKSLAIGSTGAEWMMQGKNGEPLAPGSPRITRETGRGSVAIQPVVIGKDILFVDRVGNIREFYYKLQDDGYDAEELSVLAEHLLERRGIVDCAYQQGPYGLVWFILDDGTGLALAYNKEQEVIGFARLETDGELESMSCIPGDPDDVVYFTVRRYRHLIGWDWDISDPGQGLAGETFTVPSGQTFTAGKVLRGWSPSGTRRWFQYLGAKTLTAGAVTFNDTAGSAGQVESIYIGGALNSAKWAELTTPREYIRTVERMANFFQGEDGEIPYMAFFVDSGLTYDPAVSVSFVDITSPVAITAAGHGLAVNDVVLVTDCKGLVDPDTELSGLNDYRFKVKSVSGDQVLFKHYDTGADVDARAWGEYLGGGTIRKCTTTLTGLDHLHGRTVQVLMDGGEGSEVVVGDTSKGWAPGSITLPTPAGVVHVGLGYNSDLSPMKPDFADDSGSTVGISKQMSPVWVTVSESVGFQAGNTAADLQDYDMRGLDADPDQPVRLASGSKRCDLAPVEASPRSPLLIRQRAPLPLTILAITMQIEVMDQ